MKWPAWWRDALLGSESLSLRQLLLPGEPWAIGTMAPAVAGAQPLYGPERGCSGTCVARRVELPCQESRPASQRARSLHQIGGVKIMRKLAFAAMCTALLPSTSSATMITSGEVTIAPIMSTFMFAGDGFEVHGALNPAAGDWGFLGRYFAAGSAVSVNGLQSGSDLDSAVATIGSDIYYVRLDDPNAEKRSRFSFVGPPITLDHGAGSYEGTFSFSGEICGTVPGPGVRPCVVDLPELIGSGSVSVVVIPDVPGLFRVNTVIYSFATPEPATLGLILFGLAGLGTARREAKGLRD